jgi:hypothetical protein
VGRGIVVQEQDRLGDLPAAFFLQNVLVDAVHSLLAHYASHNFTDVSGQPIGHTFKDDSGQPIGPTFKDALKFGPMGCPETSVRNYRYTLRNIPEERRSYP